MIEKPILFSTPMVQAIIEGHKTQTRRVIKPQPLVGSDGWITHTRPQIMYPTMEAFIGRKCPYNADILWVKETFYQYGEWFDTPQTDEYGELISKRTFIPQHKENYPIYYADTLPADIKILRSYKSGRGYYKRPSIFMPREAARLFLTVKSIRVERLQDISEEDAKAEGVDIGKVDTEKYAKSTAYRMLADNLPVARFVDLWNSINKARGYGWETNPYVWVVEFERQQRGISK